MSSPRASATPGREAATGAARDSWVAGAHSGGGSSWRSCCCSVVAMLTLYFRESDSGAGARRPGRRAARARAAAGGHRAGHRSRSATPGTGSPTCSAPSPRTRSCRRGRAASRQRRRASSPRSTRTTQLRALARDAARRDLPGRRPVRHGARHRALPHGLVLHGDDQRRQRRAACDVYDAVVNGAGLVGRVTSVDGERLPGHADHRSGELRRRRGRSRRRPGACVAGSVTGDVTLQYVDKNERVESGPVRRHLGPQRLDLRARHPHRPGRERRQSGRRALPEHLGGAVRRLPQARPRHGGRPDEAGSHRRGQRAARVAVGRRDRRASWSRSCVATLLQTTVAPNIRILGANPDFALIIVVCVALLQGRRDRRRVRLSHRHARRHRAHRASRPERVRLRARRLPRRALRRDRRPLGRLRAAGQRVLPRRCSPNAAARHGPVPARAARCRSASSWAACSCLLSILNTLLAAPLYLVVRLWLRGAGDLRVARAR